MLRHARPILLAVAFVFAAGFLWWWLQRDAGDPLKGVREASGPTGDVGAAQDRPQPVPAGDGTLPASTLKHSGGIAIRGRVVDPDEQPAPHVNVYLVLTSGIRYELVRSGMDGSFEFTEVPSAGEYILEAWKRGSRADSLRVSVPAEGLRGVVLYVEPETSIAGILLDQHRAPISNAPVQAHGETPGIRNGAATTDDDGAFEMKGLEGGTYHLSAGRPGTIITTGAVLGTVHVIEGERQTGLRIVLDLSGSTIAGRVIDTGGEPIAGALVHLATRDTGMLKVTTDAEGRYELSGISESEVIINATHPDYSSGFIKLPAGNERAADIVLIGTYAIEGQVVNAQTGKPIRQYRVQAYGGRWQESREGFFRRVEDPEGFFRIEGVEAGAATVVVDAAGFTRGSVKLPPVAEHETVTDVLVQLVPGARIVGTVVDAKGRGVMGADVVAASETGRTSMTAHDGRFELEDVAPGVVVVSAEHRDYPPGFATVSLESGETAEVQIVLTGGGQLRVLVTQNGRPIGAWISVSTVDKQLSSGTGDDGSVEFDAVSPGAVDVTAHLSGVGDVVQRQVVRVEAGGTTELRFDFGSTDAVIEGRVTLGGTPLSGGISARSDAAGGERVDAEVDVDGRFRIEHVTPGSVTLVFWGRQEDVGPIRREVSTMATSGQSTWVDIELDGLTRLESRLYGAPEEYVVVTRVFEDGMELPATRDAFHELHNCCSDYVIYGRNFNVSGLEPGNYNVLVLAYPEDTVESHIWDFALRDWVNVTVREGETTEFDVYLR